MARAVVGPVLHDPDDLLLAVYFDQLRTLVVAAAGAHDGVAVIEAGDGLGVAVPVLGRDVVLGEFPDCLALGVDLALEDGLLGGDEGVAVLEADGGPRVGIS